MSLPFSYLVATFSPFLSLCNKSPQTQWLKTTWIFFILEFLWVVGLEMSWVLCSGWNQGVDQGSDLIEAWGPLQVYWQVDRIQVFVVVGLRFQLLKTACLCLPCGHFHSMDICFFKANRGATLLLLSLLKHLIRSGSHRINSLFIKSKHTEGNGN